MRVAEIDRHRGKARERVPGRRDQLDVLEGASDAITELGAQGRDGRQQVILGDHQPDRRVPGDRRIDAEHHANGLGRAGEHRHDRQPPRMRGAQTKHDMLAARRRARRAWTQLAAPRLGGHQRIDERIDRLAVELVGGRGEGAGEQLGERVAVTREHGALTLRDLLEHLRARSDRCPARDRPAPAQISPPSHPVSATPTSVPNKNIGSAIERPRGGARRGNSIAWSPACMSASSKPSTS